MVNFVFMYIVQDQKSVSKKYFSFGNIKSVKKLFNAFKTLFKKCTQFLSTNLVILLKDKKKKRCFFISSPKLYFGLNTLPGIQILNGLYSISSTKNRVHTIEKMCPLFVDSAPLTNTSNLIIRLKHNGRKLPTSSPILSTF